MIVGSARIYMVAAFQDTQVPAGLILHFNIHEDSASNCVCQGPDNAILE